jgi:N-acetylneuraminic acid mutarotase
MRRRSSALYLLSILGCTTYRAPDKLDAGRDPCVGIDCGKPIPCATVTACPTPAHGVSTCINNVCDFTCTASEKAGAICVGAPDTWSSVAPPLQLRYDFAAAAGSDGRIYALGGSVEKELASSSVDAYSPRSNTWARVTNLPTPRRLLAAASDLNGRIYAIGGTNTMNGVTSLATVEVYAPSTGRWAAVASMLTPRQGLTAAAGTDGRVYAIGGTQSATSEPLATVEVYDPTIDAWRGVVSLPTPRAGLSAVGGADGRIYVFGGGPTVEAYDPAANTWSSLAPMPNPRTNVFAAALRDGRIYAIGGFDAQGRGATLVERFTPNVNRWSLATSLPGPSESAKAVTSAGGAIYVFGGTRSVAFAYTP